MESAVGILLYLPFLLIPPVALGAGVVELRRSSRDPVRLALAALLVIVAGYTTLGLLDRILFN